MFLSLDDIFPKSRDFKILCPPSPNKISYRLCPENCSAVMLTANSNLKNLEA